MKKVQKKLKLNKKKIKKFGIKMNFWSNVAMGSREISKNFKRCPRVL